MHSALSFCNACNIVLKSLASPNAKRDVYISIITTGRFTLATRVMVDTLKNAHTTEASLYVRYSRQCPDEARNSGRYRSATDRGCSKGQHKGNLPGGWHVIGTFSRCAEMNVNFFLEGTRDIVGIKCNGGVSQVNDIRESLPAFTVGVEYRNHH